MNSGGDEGPTMEASAMSRSPFTVSQWQELEQQAMIFKYIMAGLLVPPDIVLPIHNSFHSISHRFFHRSTLGYCSFHGKKVDPEPGRCRRTDGKKWRCSKDAFLDSKYCDRHMHRGRNRSRKHVESQTVNGTRTSTSTGTGSGSGSFQNLPLISFSNSQSTVSGTSHSHYQLDSIPFGIPNKDYRYRQGLKPEIGEHSSSNRAHQMDMQLDNTWPTMLSRVSALTSSHDNIVHSEYATGQSFFNNEYGSVDLVKPESDSLRPFFNEWPQTRNSWSDLDDES